MKLEGSYRGCERNAQPRPASVRSGFPNGLLLAEEAVTASGTSWSLTGSSSLRACKCKEDLG